ncbi:SDH family Clp fold serine proteinase [Caballeronia insecticola]|uniref:SDH family Clp fold serine proteinase n=1 Tax=Caballeronia insecticola TaxID=758793 RepID=UPI0018E09564|nr:hypothetical protein [Caballeronia insecticola]
MYYADCSTNAQVDPNDDTYLAELLSTLKGEPVDLMLETNGGYTDATEKIVSILTAMTTDLRVIVPRRAKSNGTVIALTGREIVMGVHSELGPIDPNVVLGPGNVVPADLILKSAEKHPPLIAGFASLAVAQTKKLATAVLTSGMLKGAEPKVIEEIVNKISTRDHYHSHGSVIDSREAADLGLKIAHLPPEDDLWQRIWLLRTMCEQDCKTHRVWKLFEGTAVSSSIAAPQGMSS